MDLTEKTQNKHRHPWELSRAQCVLNVIKKYKIKSAADIGAGDGFFAEKLRQALAGTMYAVDAGYDKAWEEAGGIKRLNDIEKLPPLDDNSGLIMMDVLEHIEDDAAFLKAALGKLPDNGYVFITVPAFQFLFSGHDIYLKHHRRYERKRLLDLIRSQNLRVCECGYFYTSLFFARTIGWFLNGKGMNRKENGIGGWRFGENHAVTRFIRAALNMDFFICARLAKLGVHLPGLSLLAVCQKSIRPAPTASA